MKKTLVILVAVLVSVVLLYEAKLVSDRADGAPPGMRVLALRIDGELPDAGSTVNVLASCPGENMQLAFSNVLVEKVDGRSAYLLVDPRDYSSGKRGCSWKTEKVPH